MNIGGMKLEKKTEKKREKKSLFKKSSCCSEVKIVPKESKDKN